MKIGDSGPSVTRLQELLNQWIQQCQNEGTQTDLYQLIVDGSYGDNTRFVVARYQIAQGLGSSGVVDEATAEALGVSADPDNVTVNSTVGGA